MRRSDISLEVNRSEILYASLRFYQLISESLRGVQVGGAYLLERQGENLLDRLRSFGAHDAVRREHGHGVSQCFDIDGSVVAAIGLGHLRGNLLGRVLLHPLERTADRPRQPP